ncbi:hypothetical protein CFBP4996_15365 [Agrobacterium leguminum]|uniref:Peptidase S74 domain-containing protein n=1 Tax=Agrobacterium deltaense NCPPB 1641 TaxID=1183425 RepID=A0A1S7U2F7_9HYPH|nr:MULTISPECIES: hypothetical protein [Agrobacterium]WFS67406.1 hypothetical protein CFBP4996_15365 [Agrobacterium leguminum]CVI61012.1 conserved hypothetical protein [Agrobacterium deltaense NCPPB 1641]
MTASKTQTQSQEVKPWGPYEQYYKENAADYKALIDSGSPQFYQGSTVAGQSAATKQSQQMATNYATNAANSQGLTSANNAVNTLAQTGGANAQANNVLSQIMGGLGMNNPASAGIASQIGSVANSSMPGQSTYSSVMNGANNPAISNLTATASGANIGNNPYLAQMVDQQQNNIADKLKNTTLPGLQSQAAAMGRGGSNAFASQINSANNIAANEMSKVATDMYANQYNTDTANMLQANNQLGSLYNQDTTNKLNAATAADSSYNNYNNLLSNLYGQQSNVYNQGISNQLNAANSANSSAQNTAQTQLSAANSAGQVYQNGLLPSQILGGVGAAQDEYNQDVLNADIARWDYNQQIGLQNIANFQALLNGQGLGTTSSQTKSSGSALGGILQAGLGLASLCDSRTKKNVKYRYTNDNNIKIYEFEYIHKPGLYEGPLAQDMLKTHPELVETLPCGYHVITDSTLLKKVA